MTDGALGSVQIPSLTRLASLAGGRAAKSVLYAKCKPASIPADSAITVLRYLPMFPGRPCREDNQFTPEKLFQISLFMVHVSERNTGTKKEHEMIAMAVVAILINVLLRKLQEWRNKKPPD